MHELSIATRLVEMACEHAEQSGASVITKLVLQIGELSAVHNSALQFSFEIVSEGTLAEGAELEINAVPVSVYCADCEEIVQLASIQRFRCPQCDAPSGDIRYGNELDISHIECDVSPLGASDAS